MFTEIDPISKPIEIVLNQFAPDDQRVWPHVFSDWVDVSGIRREDDERADTDDTYEPFTDDEYAYLSILQTYVGDSGPEMPGTGMLHPGLSPRAVRVDLDAAIAYHTEYLSRLVQMRIDTERALSTLTKPTGPGPQP